MLNILTFFPISANTGNEVFSIKAEEFAEDLGDAFEVGKKYQLITPITLAGHQELKL